MSASHLHHLTGSRAAQRSLGPVDAVGLAGFLLAVAASVAVWAVVILVLVLLIG